MTRSAKVLRVLGLLAWLALPATGIAQEAATASGAAAPKATYSRKGADTCIACHDDGKTLSIFRTPHAQRSDERTPFGHGNLQCEACHGAGGAHSARIRSGQPRPPIPNFDDESKVPVGVQNDACLACHKGDMRHGWTGSSHERNGLSCAGCHSSHATRDAVLVQARQSEVCYGCHKQQQAEARLPSAHPLQEGKMACTSCHDAHGTIADANLRKTTLNDTCYSCHADKRGPFLWEHAPAAEDCSSCHKPHGSTQPALLTQRAPMLCQQCHSQAGHPSLPVSSSYVAGGPASTYLLGGSCMNCHSQVHGSNHPSGAKLGR
ncbi:MAG: DmsE family decaheme c-type cytochrome [Steroidobacteraceae bacterium]